MTGKNQCKHGSLERSCEICELESENARLRGIIKRTKKAMRNFEPLEDTVDILNEVKKGE